MFRYRYRSRYSRYSMSSPAACAVSARRRITVTSLTTNPGSDGTPANRWTAAVRSAGRRRPVAVATPRPWSGWLAHSRSSRRAGTGRRVSSASLIAVSGSPERVACMASWRSAMGKLVRENMPVSARFRTWASNLRPVARSGPSRGTARPHGPSEPDRLRGRDRIALRPPVHRRSAPLLWHRVAIRRREYPSHR